MFLPLETEKRKSLLFLCFVPLLFLVFPSSDMTAEDRDEIAELKVMIQTMQKSMENMITEYQGQLQVLQDRVEELEAADEHVTLEQEILEEKMLEQETSTGVLRSTLIDRLDWSGYYDFEYRNAENDSISTFRQHHLSLFISSTTEDEKWKFFSEIEFEDASDSSLAGTGESDVLTIETAWLEYRRNDTFKLRAGKLLLPQYWQTNHYPNLTLSTQRPLMVGKILPKDIIGIQAHGNWWFENEMGLTYAVYVGNGQHMDNSALDGNDNKSVGGRITLHFGRGKRFRTFDVSASGYSGRDDNSNTEHMFGLDTQMRIGKLEFLSEFVVGSQEIRMSMSPDSHLYRIFDESTSTGYYLQIGYNFLTKWHAFYRFDELDLLDDGATLFDEHRHTLGLNFRPRTNISLKLEGFEAIPDDNRDSFTGLDTSVVFNF